LKDSQNEAVEKSQLSDRCSGHYENCKPVMHKLHHVQLRWRYKAVINGRVTVMTQIKPATISYSQLGKMVLKKDTSI
jgi:hypothetical protein